MKKFINIKGALYDLSPGRVMGILNVTPDSFYPGSRTFSAELIAERVDAMIDEGVDIIDVGGYSSRPRATDIDAKEEIRRVSEALSVIRKRSGDTIISVDTFRTEVARMALSEFSVDMVNDISGGTLDNSMFEFIASVNIPYVMMHMQGTPANMQDSPAYGNVVNDIIRWLSARLEKLSLLGVKDVIIDPGFGFGKNPGHNWEILEKLERFSIFDLPVMVGLSRKSMVWKELGIESGEALGGTIVLNTVAMMKGASILRVHDVKEAVQAVRLIRRLREVQSEQ